MRSRILASALAVIVFSMLAAVRPAAGATISVGIAAFGPGSTLTTFIGLPDGTEVNGLTVNGIQFSYSLGSGHVVIDGGPGVTNNISPPNIVSVGDPTGVLTLVLPGLIDTFGYGYALLTNIPVANATTIQLFNGATPVGSMSYGGVPDPTFTGGFAGIQSTLLFDRVSLTFNAAAAPAFALDNVRTFNSISAVPEPGTVVLIATGFAVLWSRRRR
jgi:hypothetical protein